MKLDKGEGTLKIEKVPAPSPNVKQEAVVNNPSDVKLEEKDTADVKMEVEDASVNSGDNVKKEETPGESGESKETNEDKKEETHNSNHSEEKSEKKSEDSPSENNSQEDKSKDDASNNNKEESKEKSENEESEKKEEEAEKPKLDEAVSESKEATPSSTHIQHKDEASDKEAEKKEEVMEFDKTEEKTPDSEKIVEQFEELDEKTGETIVKKITAAGKEIIEWPKKEDEVEEKKSELEVKPVEVSATCDKPVHSETSDKKPENQNSEVSEVKTDVKAASDVDKFKAMFPELEVMQRLPEIDAILLENSPVAAGGRGSPNTTQGTVDTTVAHLLAQSYNNPIKWPKVSFV